MVDCAARFQMQLLSFLSSHTFFSFFSSITSTWSPQEEPSERRQASLQAFKLRPLGSEEHNSWSRESNGVPAMASFICRRLSASHPLLQTLESANPFIHSIFSKPLNASPSNPSSPLPPRPPAFPKSPLFFPSIPRQSVSSPSIKFHHLPQIPRHLSSLSPENPPPDLRNQEITGPTVDPDVSPLANETREVLDSLRRSVSDFSTALGLLAVAQLGLGAWISYAALPPAEVSVQGLAAFAFPFSAAFLLRRTLQPIKFLQKMEEQRRLQVLTLALQVSKILKGVLLRLRVLCFCCAAGVSAGSLVVMWIR